MAMCDDFGGPVEELSLDRRAYKAGRELIETVIYQMEKWEGPFFVVKHREYDKRIFVTIVDFITLDLVRDTKGEVEVTTYVYSSAPSFWDRLFKKVEKHSYLEGEVVELERIATRVVLDAELIGKMREAYDKWYAEESQIRQTVADRKDAQERLDGARAINRII